ncbi:hypothetical protein GF377_06080 [candidate division GN15 bacterium]|nr:hypothetical protein [candidate division GN15 bacterium]
MDDMTYELRQILRDHECWLSSGGQQGRRANLSRADLRGTDLRGWDLTGIVLYRADLRGANLAGTILCHANLSRARLAGANLDGADMARANLRGTNLSDVGNLRSIRNFWMAPHASAGLPGMPVIPREVGD